MSPLLLFFIMTMVLTILLSLAGQMLPTHDTKLEKMAPYECGFDPMKSSRLPFSFRFFLMGMLFLMFDLEMALLLPIPLSTLLFYTSKSMLFLMMFLMILTMGLLYEWLKGGLDWAQEK